MNLYIRYFDEECVVHSAEEAYEFLCTLPNMSIDMGIIEELQKYMDSPMPYPKRYKVRPRVYFIVIKTQAETLEEFKMNGTRERAMTPAFAKRDDRREEMFEQPGWYEGEVLFKRVVPIPGTGKFKYLDTRFKARCKAHNSLECYERLTEHLRSRQDVDPRSQFPSARGKNFSWTYLGMEIER